MIKSIIIKFFPPKKDPNPDNPPANRLFKGVEKPTSVLANMIALEILQNNCKILNKPRLDRNWNDVEISHDKFNIKMSLYHLSDKDSKCYSFTLEKPSILLEENPKEIIVNAYKNWKTQEEERKRNEAKFKNQEKALEAIENWMGVKEENVR